MWIALTISDDGCGFDPANVSAEHLGLGIIRERAQAIDAWLEIESRPDAGTRIKVVWPARLHTPREDAHDG
jgi:two-component system nitrate/nitrite sensor histidine kinase NarX